MFLSSPANLFSSPSKLNAVCLPRTILTADFYDNALPDRQKLIEISLWFMFCSQRNWISCDLNSYFQILQKCKLSVCVFVSYSMATATLNYVFIFLHSRPWCKTIFNPVLITAGFFSPPPRFGSTSWRNERKTQVFA